MSKPASCVRSAAPVTGCHACRQVARGNAEQGGGAKKTLAGAVAMMRELGNSGLALISGGRVEDGEESPDYLRVPHPLTPFGALRPCGLPRLHAFPCVLAATAMTLRRSDMIGFPASQARACA